MALRDGEYRSGSNVVDADGRRVIVLTPAVAPITGGGPDAQDADGRRVLKVGS
jgi:hypothetical protein